MRFPHRNRLEEAQGYVIEALPVLNAARLTSEAIGGLTLLEQTLDDNKLNLAMIDSSRTHLEVRFRIPRWRFGP